VRLAKSHYKVCLAKIWERKYIPDIGDLKSDDDPDKQELGMELEKAEQNIELLYKNQKRIERKFYSRMEQD